jgi:dnd system-associated protein 4
VSRYVSVHSPTTYFPNLLALATEKDPSVLADAKFEERLKMFEEYANGGLEILGSALDAHSVVLDAVITEITKARTRTVSDYPDHDDIEDLISE